MRRGQGTVIIVALLLPATLLAMIGLACLGARVQAEHAQRVADAAALRAALGQPTRAADAAVVLSRVGSDVRAEVTLPATALRLPLLGGTAAFAARATATARRVVTGEGREGAVLVG